MMPCAESKSDINLSNEYHVGGGLEAVALDCEMVWGGSDGSLDICARVCLIDEDENILFHTYVQPQIAVTNYRYNVSHLWFLSRNFRVSLWCVECLYSRYEVTGLMEEHLRNAMPLEKVQEKILRILYSGKTKVLVGHNLDRDMDCLRFNYPDYLLRYKFLFLYGTNALSLPYTKPLS